MVICPKDAHFMKWQTVKTLISVCTVCQDLPVQKLRIIIHSGSLKVFLRYVWTNKVVIG